MKIEVKNTVDNSTELKKNTATKSASVTPSILNPTATSHKKDDNSL
jgi:hypothetical protein